MPRVLFVFHGMGRQLDGWCDDVTKRLDEAAARHERFVERFDGRALSELVDVVPISYDVCFRDLTAAWQADTEELRKHDDVLGAGGAGRLVHWLTVAAGADEKKFFWSHAADVLAYVIADDARTRARVECLAQMTAVLQGDLVQPAVLAHSLGTKVAHDTLHLLATGAGGDETAAFTADAGYRMRTITTVANVGALLSEVVRDLPKPDRSIVHPLHVPDDCGVPPGYCEQYFNYRHALDPFTLLRPFVPPTCWGGGYTTAPALEHFPPNWNPHDFVHFLDHPAVHMRLMRALLPSDDALFSKADIADAVSAYQGPPLPPCPAAVKALRVGLPALGARLAAAADARDVVELVQTTAAIYALVERARGDCHDVV